MLRCLETVFIAQGIRVFKGNEQNDLTVQTSVESRQERLHVMEIFKVATAGFCGLSVKLKPLGRKPVPILHMTVGEGKVRTLIVPICGEL